MPNGKTIMIKWWLPGSLVDCKIVKQKKDYVQAHITQVKEMDKRYATETPRCPHYQFHYQTTTSDLPEHKRGCGGCKWQVVSYPQQLELKYQIIHDCFRKLASKMWWLEVLPVVASPAEFGYRNKIEFSFGKYLRKGNAESGWEIEEHRLAGFHKQGMFEKVVDVDQCYLIDQDAHSVYAFFKEALRASGLPVYDVKQHQGFLRHMVIRRGTHTWHTIVYLSVATHHLMDHPEDRATREALLEQRKADKQLQEKVTTLLINENNGLADIVKPQDVEIWPVWWPGTIYEELHFPPSQTWGSGDTWDDEETVVRFRISPFSFFQTNTLGAQLLFTKAVEMIWHTTGNIIDLYCGSGTIGLTCLALWKGQRVKWIEVVDDAVQDAYFNAKINGYEEKADFYAGKAEDLLKAGIIDDTFFVWGDVVIVDPPREWLHPRVVDFLIEVYQRFGCKILYISCNPVTMARDIDRLLDAGMSCGPIQPVDMFPHTHHIELITILQ